MDVAPESVEKAKAICDRIAEGETLAAAAKDVGLSLREFRRVLSSVCELETAYRDAREIRADVEVDELITIADNVELDPQRARNMLDTRKWRASKLYARVYGDRIDVNVSQSISIGEALTEARSRILRPIHDQLPTLDAEVIDVPQLGQAQPADKQSVGQEPGEPDIFS